LEVYDAVKARRSIRKYKTSAIEEDKLMRLLNAARLSPSAGNRQPWKFIVVTDSEIKRRLADVCRWKMWRMSQVEKAPLVIVGCGIPKESIRVGSLEKGYVVDVTIALQSIVLTATSLGLGTCWIGAFDEKKVRELLGIPEDIKVVALLTVGYPDETPKPKSRKSLDKIICYDHYK